MKCFCSTSLGLAIATGLLLSSCGKDLQTTEPATEIVVPIQIQAGVGSTFTYELKRYDNTGALIDQDGGEIVLTNKNASFAGRSGVHQFTVNGLPVWQYQVDAQDNMWEYHPAISGGSIHYAARWQRLPTSGPGKYESVIFDSAMSTPNSHLKQSMVYEFVAREPYLLSGVTYEASKVRVIGVTDATLNGLPFSSQRDTLIYTYIPKLSINAGYVQQFRYDNSVTVQKLITADIR